MSTWDAAAQKARREAWFRTYREALGGAVGPDGSWHGRDREMGFREKAWHCFPLLAGEAVDVERANGILRTLKPARCHFTPMTFLQLLLRHGDRLDADVQAGMREYVRAGLGPSADGRIHFSMYNDNFATMACFTLLIGGRMMDDGEARKAGLGKLEDMADLLRRRGTVMEYGSPTYTPIHAHVLADLANHEKDPAVRDLALQCEERMWAEIASHWHAPTSRMAGPYSRAYWVDTVGHTHLIHGFLWAVFGDAIFVNPVSALLHPHPDQIIHCGWDTLMMPNVAWLTSADCHCPDILARILLEKPEGFTVTCTSESIPSLIRGHRTYGDGRREFFDNPHEYPAFSGPNTAYLAGDFALGTGYSGYHDGALTETVHVTYRRKVPARCLEDTRAVTCRYIYDEKLPERRNYYDVFDSEHGPEGFRDEGRKWGLQHGPCSLAAYRPKPFEAHETFSMKLSVLLPTHFAPVEEVRIGGTKPGTVESADLRPVFVRDGPVFLCFRPLACTDHGRRAAVRLQSVPHFLMVSFYNYEGPTRAFGLREVLLTSSGVLVHAASNRDFPDLDAFMDWCGQGVLTDGMEESEGGVTRRIRYRRPDLDLRLALSPVSEGILMATINGRPRPEPRFSATGIEADRLPFLEP